ncbi:type 4b pilus protein PilO2 [Pseudomonas sp. JG-B]|uniref:type 4b pilus protein PilO2 n=1 Tax=Pseudomonas sp. JG-B TaxID=2603214 RepID=UPI00129D3A23|nr:type 4b pilus protein PilO2 [Pseudomonas sp. JG-B]MRK19092.1 pilus assembly protein PilO [Pseudomonas sp. JG-B]
MEKSFVSGLLWQALERRSYMAEARQLGKELKMDIVSIRNTPMIRQAGFVQRSQGAYKGMFSLAAALAGQLGDTFLAAFKLPDGQFALVAVHDGAVLPEADFVASKDEVLGQLRQIWGRSSDGLEFPEDKIYAPAELEFGGIELDIEQVLKPEVLKKEYTLQPLTFGLSPSEVKGVAIFSVVALLIGGGFFGYYLYSENEAEKNRLLRIKMQQEQLAEMNRRTREAQTKEALAHPWAKLPAVNDFRNTCNNAINSVPLFVGGWGILGVKCDSSSVIATFERQGNMTVNTFAEYAKKYFTSEPLFESDGNIAAVRNELDMPFGGDDEIIGMEKLLLDVSTHFQSVGIAAVLTEVPVVIPPPPPLPGEDPSQVPPAPTADWRQYSFKFETKIPPELSLKQYACYRGSDY